MHRDLGSFWILLGSFEMLTGNIDRDLGSCAAPTGPQDRDFAGFVELLESSYTLPRPTQYGKTNGARTS